MSKDSLIDLIKGAQGPLTQNEFAKKCGMSSSNLTRIYHGEQIPSPALLKKISMAVNDPLLYEKLMIAAEYWDSTAPYMLMPIRGLFNHRLRTLMKESNISISELSELSGVPAREIQSYVDDETIPQRPLELISLAQALHVYSDYLSGESPYRTEEDRHDAYQSTSRLSAAAEKFSFDGAPKFIEALNNLFDELSMDNPNNVYARVETMALFTKVIFFFRDCLMDCSGGFNVKYARLDAIDDPLSRMVASYNQYNADVINTAEGFIRFRQDFIDIQKRIFQEEHPDIVKALDLNDSEDDEDY